MNYIARRWEKLISVFFIVSLYYIIVLRLCYYQHEDGDLQVCTNHTNDVQDKKTEAKSSNIKTYTPAKNETAETDLKYILIYTPNNYPFHLLQTEQKSFINSKCKYTNCYITADRKYLKDLKDFNALLFSGLSLRGMKSYELPKSRSLEQKYVFATLESAHLHPVTNPMFDNFFNWTWTYRLDSDISWKYITIYDLNGQVIGPAKDMKWPKNLKPVTEHVKSKLRYKTKAVAWFVSRCVTRNRRERFVSDFKTEFFKYNCTFDEYGVCGNKVCGQRCTKFSECFEMMQKDYYFYFSFENSSDEDYVTEKLWIALNNFVVPVVFGGANYSRFLPPSSYLNAGELGPRNLAKAINDAIRNLTIYYDFFRWTNHFKYESTEDTTEICNICTALNDEEKMKKLTTYSQFRLWWNGPIRQKTYDFMLKYFLENDKLLNLASSYNSSRESNLILINNIIR